MIIVGFVVGGLLVSIVILMVMGVNIGIIIINIIVSFGYVCRGDEFCRVFVAAMVYDFFNLFSVVIFFFFEIMFGFLEKMGVSFVGLLVGGDVMDVGGFNFIKFIVKFLVKFLENFVLGGLFDMVMGVVMVLFGILIIFVVIILIGKLLKLLMVGKVKDILYLVVGCGLILGIMFGMVIMVLV